MLYYLVQNGHDIKVGSPKYSKCAAAAAEVQESGARQPLHRDAIPGTVEILWREYQNFIRILSEFYQNFIRILSSLLCFVTGHQDVVPYCLCRCLELN